MTTAGAQDTPDIDALRSERNAYIDHFRVHGERRADRADALEAKLYASLRHAAPGSRAALLYELALLLRMVGRFEDAIRTYEAAIADAAGGGDVTFDSWIGIARAHAYGTRDHGAAEGAFQRAVEAAGAEPTRKQRYEMADYRSQLQAGRGELDTALINALQANRLAESDAERFYAELDSGDVLQKFAESCDYRKLVDAKTFSIRDGDAWGACRRAVAAARSKYVAARDIAERLGWGFLRNQAEDFINQLEVRQSLINQRASMDTWSDASVFSAEDAAHILVNDDFAAGASKLTDYPALAELIERVVAEGGPEDARSVYLLGLKADIEGNEGAAVGYFDKAVGLLEQERSSFFDLRQRGTVVENRLELVRDLALRLLARGRYDDAFTVFESIRARGLGELASTFERHKFSDTERRWLAGLVDIDSRESAILNGLVETTIAGIEPKNSGEMLQRLDEVRMQRRDLRDKPEFKDTVETVARAASAERTRAKLAELRALAKETGIPVLLYWVTSTNVIVWVIGPDSMEVKTVFLPEVALVKKVTRVVESIRTADRPFDVAAARQLYAYLIQPFLNHLTGEEVMIIPQGPLVALPFEALIDAQTGAFFVEKVAISYAPSATFAASAMRRKPVRVSSVTAIYDKEIENDTNEIERIARTPAIQVTANPSEDLSAKDMLALLGGAKAVHVLLHGEFDEGDPLQSHVDLNNPTLSPDENKVTAAELLAADWRGARIVVFSSCEGARMNVRISNEVYGLSWAPLIGGAQAVMMSRWRVRAASNADWMAGFYYGLSAGDRSPAVAAAETVRRMVRGAQAHPYYWAGPQIFGR